MATCQQCHTSGSNMNRCKKCNQIWCRTCLVLGRGKYTRQSSTNKCPYCGTLNQVEIVK